MSPPLYYYYNSNLIEELTSPELKALDIGYVDDVGLLVSGDTVEKYLLKIAKLYPILIR